MGYIWHYSNQFGHEEIDVIVDNNELDDPELCEYYDIDYNQVNCIEGTN